MKTDYYTKAMLTVIAVCLVLLVVKDQSLFPIAKAGYNSPGFIPLNEDGSINVKLSGYDEMDVVIKGIETYDQLKVNLTDVNTSDMIKVDLSEISTRDELDVNLDEIGGSFLPMGGPIPVKTD